jgi:hypothetical protein
MVGWSTEEGYRSEFLPHFNGAPAPPAVTWRVADMAEAAVRLLRLRRAEPGAAPVHRRVAVRLRMAKPEDDSDGSGPVGRR